MSDKIEVWYAVNAVIFGVSHIVQPNAWARLFDALREKEYGGLYVGGFSVIIAMLLITTHNVWEWNSGVIVTVIGWMMLLKGAVYLAYPQSFQRIVPKQNFATKIAAAGWALLAVGVAVLARFVA